MGVLLLPPDNKMYAFSTPEAAKEFVMETEKWVLNESIYYICIHYTVIQDIIIDSWHLNDDGFSSLSLTINLEVMTTHLYRLSDKPYA